MAIATAALALLKGLFGADQIDAWVDHERAYTKLEMDGVFSKLTELRAQLVLLFDLPVRISEVEEVEKVAEGRVVKSFHITLSIPRGFTEDEEEEE